VEGFTKLSGSVRIVGIDLSVIFGQSNGIIQMIVGRIGNEVNHGDFIDFRSVSGEVTHLNLDGIGTRREEGDGFPIQGSRSRTSGAFAIHFDKHLVDSGSIGLRIKGITGDGNLTFESNQAVGRSQDFRNRRNGIQDTFRFDTQPQGAAS